MNGLVTSLHDLMIILSSILRQKNPYLLKFPENNLKISLNEGYFLSKTNTHASFIDFQLSSSKNLDSEWVRSV